MCILSNSLTCLFSQTFQMSVCSQEEAVDLRYAGNVSDVDPDEYNHQYLETDSEEYTEILSHRNTRKVNIEPKSTDSGYNSIYRVVDGKSVKIVFYQTSTTPNMYIRDAITGVRCPPFRVGTEDEDLFFSVMLATGETGRREPSVLFYDNPEQYERHFFTKVSAETKRAWMAKATEARQRASQRTAAKTATVVR